MSRDVLADVRAAVAAGGDPDDVLRATVAALADSPGLAWAGVSFAEGDELVLGPESGSPDEKRRRSVAVHYLGARVAELHVDGDADPELLEQIADLIAEQCLVGWDTGGEPWT